MLWQAAVASRARADLLPEASASMSAVASAPYLASLACAGQRASGCARDRGQPRQVVRQSVPFELSAPQSPGPSSGIALGDLQKRHVTVVDLAQSGVALLLLGLDLRDARGAETALLLDNVTVTRIAAEPQVGPLKHKTAVSHLRPPTIHGAPIIHPPSSAVVFPAPVVWGQWLQQRWIRWIFGPNQVPRLRFTGIAVWYGIQVR
jgi:hypothetical protein